MLGQYAPLPTLDRTQWGQHDRISVANLEKVRTWSPINLENAEEGSVPIPLSCINADELARPAEGLYGSLEARLSHCSQSPSS